MELLVKHCRPGDPVQYPAIFDTAWDECVELQMQPREVWVGRTFQQMLEMERLELYLVEDDRAVAGLGLAYDPSEVHVGPCMAVYAQYVLPTHRLRGASFKLMRAAMRMSKAAGVAVLAYTHRVGPWRYETIYRRVR